MKRKAFICTKIAFNLSLLRTDVWFLRLKLVRFSAYQCMHQHRFCPTRGTRTTKSMRADDKNVFFVVL